MNSWLVSMCHNSQKHFMLWFSIQHAEAGCRQLLPVSMPRHSQVLPWLLLLIGLVTKCYSLSPSCPVAETGFVIGSMDARVHDALILALL